MKKKHPIPDARNPYTRNKVEQRQSDMPSIMTKSDHKEFTLSESKRSLLHLSPRVYNSQRLTEKLYSMRSTVNATDVVEGVDISRENQRSKKKNTGKVDILLEMSDNKNKDKDNKESTGVNSSSQAQTRKRM